LARVIVYGWCDYLRSAFEFKTRRAAVPPLTSASTRSILYRPTEKRISIEDLEKQLHSYCENGFGRWAVILKETGRVIGMCGLMWLDTDKDRVLELGYLFNREFWHNGYAVEAAIAYKRYAFDALGFDEVFSLIRDNNCASMNVAVRCGMLVRGRYMKHYKGEGMTHYIFFVRISDKAR
jgi:RimJ/RimL family protein N-acetyltransferase